MQEKMVKQNNMRLCINKKLIYIMIFFQREKKIDHSINFFDVFNDDIVAEDKDRPIEEQVDVPSFFLVDDIAWSFYMPIYNEYNDDYDSEFYEKPTVFLSPGSVLLQQSDENAQPFKENSHPAHYSHGEEHEENSELVEGNSLPLCFSSFKLLEKKIKSLLKQRSVI